MVPYNIEGLIDIIGGKEEAMKRLNYLFRRLDAGYDDDWYASGNEPSFAIPWVFNWVGKPYKTQEIVNQIITKEYFSKKDGLPGNDDLGSMGAWYVFAAIGLYPEIPGVDGFSINSPIFPYIKMHFKHGDLVIKGGSENKFYIHGMKLNKEPYENAWIPWNSISSGGLIEYKLAGKPSFSWGTKVMPPSFE